jgi:isocitrate dehydrogenase (NAD+)
VHTVTLIPGDGIGPSIAKATQAIIDAAGVKIVWDIQEAGMTAVEKYKNPLPQAVLDSIARNTVALKGPLTTPLGTGFRSVNSVSRWSRKAWRRRKRNDAHRNT